jgi:MFS family permease
MTNLLKLKAMRVFLLVWFGQLVSVVGSGLTGFALDVWVYQQTGSITQFALAFLFSHLPPLLLSSFAGAIVDRGDRRLWMIISDAAAGLSILALAPLILTGHLQVWHVYITTAIASAFSAFQSPAYEASIPLLVPKQYLSRANGLTHLSETLSMLLPPVLGGLLLVTIHLQGVILVDFITFIFAIAILFSVQFPKVPADASDATEKRSLFADVVYGWQYIIARPGLLGLLLFFAAANFVLAIVCVLLTPLVLSFASPTSLGMVLAIDGIGMLVGTLIISTWKGPSRQINSILGFHLLGGLCILATGLRASVALIAVAAFLFAMGSPIINSASQFIWQTKVAPSVQGRVFAVERIIVCSLQPLAYILAGPLADRIFEPLMAENGPLAASIGQVIGVGPGRGVGLMFMAMGVLSVITTVAGYQYPRLRFVENELPDQI